MVIVPDPPDAVMRAVLTLRVSAHRVVEGPSGVTEVDEELHALVSAVIKRTNEQRRTPLRRIMFVPYWIVTTIERCLSVRRSAVFPEHRFEPDG